MFTAESGRNSLSVSRLLICFPNERASDVNELLGGAIVRRCRCKYAAHIDTQTMRVRWSGVNDLLPNRSVKRTTLARLIARKMEFAFECAYEEIGKYVYIALLAPSVAVASSRRARFGRDCKRSSRSDCVCTVCRGCGACCMYFRAHVSGSMGMKSSGSLQRKHKSEGGRGEGRRG